MDVAPRYLSADSDPDARRFVFAYHITITNLGERTVRLVSRRWRIVDASGREHSVEGEGVVGRQPVLEPGQVFEYQSYSPLATAWGTMEGVYVMEILPSHGPSAETFEAAVSRFYLVMPAGEPAAAAT